MGSRDDISVEEVAAESLGLNEEQADALFDSDGFGWEHFDDFCDASTNAERLAVAIKELETYL